MSLADINNKSVDVYVQKFQSEQKDTNESPLTLLQSNHSPLN